MNKPQVPEGSRTNATSTSEWLAKSARYIPDVLFDQKLILDGYRIRFAIDFSVLRDFLRPWGQAAFPERVVHKSTVNLSESEIENIFATAYLTNEMHKKKHLCRSLLLPEYLEEFLEDSAFVALNGLYRDWYRMKQAMQRVESEYPQLAEVAKLDAEARNRWFRDNRIAWLNILGREFVTLAKLAFAGEIRYPRASTCLSFLNFGDEFVDLHEIAMGTDDALGEEQYAALQRPMLKFLMEGLDRRLAHMNEIERARTRVQIEDSCRRDARALQRVIQLNKQYWQNGRKEVVYLLTSSQRFWTAYDTYRDNAFRKACEIATKSVRNEEATYALRHPFCIVLLLAYWPSAVMTDDVESKRKLIETLSALHRRAYVYRPIIGYRRNDAEDQSGEYSDKHARVVGRTSQSLEHWKNLALSLQQSELLPAAFSAEGITRAATDFLVALRDSTYHDFQDILLRARESEYQILLKAVRHMISIYVGDIVDERFLQERAGQVFAFPYLLHFETQKIQQLINKLRAPFVEYHRMHQQDIEQNLNTVRQCLKELIGVLDPDQNQIIEAPILTGALLVLLDRLDDAERFVKAGTPPTGKNACREWGYLRALIQTRQVLTKDEVSVASVISARKALTKLLSRPDQDPRIQDRILLLRGYELEYREGAAKAAEIDSYLQSLKVLATGDESELYHMLPGEILRELRWRTWNNYVYFATTFGRRLNNNKWTKEAYSEAMTHLERYAQDYPAEVKHTIGKCFLNYALTFNDEPTRMDHLVRARKWYDLAADEKGTSETSIGRNASTFDAEYAELAKEINKLKK